MAAPEFEREVRKRRDRRDSGSAHERKERRPHSEERAPPPPLPAPPLHDYNRLESERRAERLSRARRPQFGGKRRRQPVRVPKQLDWHSTKENECLLTEETVIRLDSPTPVDCAMRMQFYERYEQPESIDITALHRQLGREEPARSVAAEHARPGDPTDTRRRERDPVREKIAVLKKNISRYEAEYESRHGVPITAAERITDVQLTRMYEALRRLQAERKCLKADPVEYALKVKAAKLQKARDDKLETALRSEKSMVDVVVDIEEWLEGCRKSAGRSNPESTWTAPQLAAEKACVQKALLRLEAARGRPPAHSADRGAARHLYERYRAVKRAMSTRPDSVIGGANGELATIHEHEAMLFNTSVDSSSDSQEKASDASHISQESISTPLQSPPARTEAEELPSTTSSAKSSEENPPPSNEGLHCMNLEDLSRALSEAKLQKCVLRRSIKDYEVSFEIQNSRKVQRDDKKGKEEEYLRYKAIKARIKLLNALINKQKFLSR